jgi:hypothetical protein
MKRSDLKVSEAYWYAPPWAWDNNNGRKAVVVDAARWREGFGRGDQRFYKLSDGEKGVGGVLVEVHQEGHSPSREVVPLAYLRGPHDQVAAIVKERKAQAQQAAAERKARSDAFLARAKTLIARADAVGISAQLNGGRLSLLPDDVERLLNAYERAATMPAQPTGERKERS